MLKKIISGGQTGADRAALDVAIKFNITHGGWIPKGRKTEDGPLPDKYHLLEMPPDNYEARTERNVQDSDGTLIIARGHLTGGTDYARHMTLKHKKQLLGIDLNLMGNFEAASLVASWIKLRHVKVLNVAGPMASEDGQIYSDVVIILERVIQILNDEDRKAKVELKHSKNGKLSESPQTVDEAVNLLIYEMSLKDKSVFAKMSEGDLINLHFSFGLYIRNRLLYPRNDRLLESCREVSMDKYLHWDQASSVIIKELWKRLKDSHKLHVVK